MGELLPCPFCGSSDVRIVPLGGPYFVACNGCDVDESTGDDEAAAIAAWNRRAPVPSGWRAMESAPRDGRFLSALRGGHVKIAMFERYESDITGATVEHFVCDGAGRSLDPIAWMPLPAPFTGNPEDLR